MQGALFYFSLHQLLNNTIFYPLIFLKTRKKKKGKVYSKSFRKVSAALSIYDLEQKLNVWSGRIDKEISAENEYKESSLYQLVTLAKAVSSGANSEDQLYPYPPPPTTPGVVEQIFKGFGENMPEKK